MASAFTALELYAGIGGFAAAVPEAEVRLAVEQSAPALAVYRANHPHPTRAANLEGFDLAAVDADLWWMSPPCQPYTRRGRGRDLDDPRTRSFRRVVEALAARRPRWVALENVPEFQGSRAHALLREALAGYRVEETVLCPTELGAPNRRRRFYLVAGDGPLPLGPGPAPSPRLADYLDAEGPLLPAEVVDRYRHALHLVDADGVTACFTAAYGRSWVRSGSYLRTPAGPRRFTAGEVARLLGFPAGFRVAPDAWGLVGNSLSTWAARAVLVRFARSTADQARRTE